MNKELLKEVFISGLTRHATQALGGVFVGTGIASADAAPIVLGVLMNTAAFAWSAWRKRRRARLANGIR